MIRIGKIKIGGTLFTHLILSFTLLAVIIIGLVGGYLYVQANRLMVDEIAKDSRQRLITSRDYIENTLLKKYENSIRNKSLSTLSLESQSMLNYLLDSKWEGNISRITAFRKDLEIFKLANEGVYKISVYFQKGNYIVDSSQFYMKPDNSPDAPFVQKSLADAANRWTFRTLADGEKVMTYAIALPYGSLPKLAEGTMYIDVSIDYIYQMVSSTMSSPLEKLYVFSESGGPVIHTGAADEDELDAVVKSMKSGGQAVQSLYYNKRDKYVLSFLSDQTSDYHWKYAMIRPMNSFVSSSEQLKGKIFASCLLVLLIGLLISYLISRRVYDPMKALVASIRGFYQPGSANESRNEYAIIGSTLDTLGRKIESLQSKAKINELKNLVLGGGIGLEYDNDLPQNCQYMVCRIQMLEGSSSDAFKAAYEQLEAYGNYRFVSLNAQEAAIIYAGEPDAPSEALEQALLTEMHAIKKQTAGELKFGAAFGSFVHTAGEIPFSYQDAVHAYRYRFFYGSDAIIAYSSLSSNKVKPHLFSFDNYKYALKAGNEVGVSRFIDDFQKELAEGGIQLENVELGLLQLVTVLYQVVIELELQQIIPPSSLFDEFKKETLEDTLQAIREMSANITAHVQEAGNHAHTEIILKLKKFIDDNLHEDLSLHKLSEVASLAPTYISTLFGTVMNETFTEYVTRVRLEKAAGLLREDKSLSVVEISGLVGYRNSQYFHNKFKTRYGVTPIQYRNAGGSAT
ncbi:AraC family transcriptional regulator [Paenibacillus sp. N4]|uniref:helix-turn-helix domain-containing protein n=1 Tax=Paenibacillus vietnamensis TaxID=2590547 RepID=UPI001CD14C52|nr:AraC family transcriptional regulator [Paenibacillus vietnamensis]MCA0755413.1 AraC family transcriptional regulator [Paenibacillus vietnamensis]